MSSHRVQTGIPELDARLGGGLLPGTLTVVLGATGIGKTQLGIQFLDHGKAQEGERGVLFDMTSRGDNQSHEEYAERLCHWKLKQFEDDGGPPAEFVWKKARARRDVCRLFKQVGRRVSLQDLSEDQQREWQADLNRRLDQTIRFFYGNFVHGVRRCVIDGVEPVERASDSFQFETFEYIYHQLLRKESDWVARDLFRAQFREQAAQVEAHAYKHEDVACLMLCTSHEVMLDDLIERPIETGDVLSNANTIILMGKTRDGSRTGRALYVAKHRGSACEESIWPYRIDGERGIVAMS
ncbi:recombinase RecA [Planctomyces sp. SCGC AG-212-M04]|nr:recombinase RecA [Planctomyces sp. SCGC AG-212-M04]